MASTPPDLSVFLNPPLCANTKQMVDGKVTACLEKAEQVCSSCKLVQVRTSQSLQLMPNNPIST